MVLFPMRYKTLVYTIDVKDYKTLDINMIQNELEKARAALRPVILRNTGFTLPTWEGILQAINLAFITKPERQMMISPTETRYNYLLVDDMFYFSNLLTFPLMEERYGLSNEFSGLKDATLFLQSIFPPHPHNGPNTMKFNLVEFAHTSNPIHIDTQDMAYWHIAGKVKWGFDPQICEEIIIEPNDIILVPQGCYHGYYPMGPRAGFTFGFFKD